MTLPTPSIEYFLLCPMLIVFSVAVVGVLVEAFVPRRGRYSAQVILALGGLIAAFVAIVVVARSLPASGRTAVLGAVAVDRPALFLQGTVLLVGVMAIIFMAERTARGAAAQSAASSQSRCGRWAFARTGFLYPASVRGTGQRHRTRGGAGGGCPDGAFPVGDAVHRRHDGVPRLQ